jgi:hypothetical protein
MQEKKVKLLSIGMSNEMALHILPFGTGYLLDDVGEPDAQTIAAAMALQAAQSITVQGSSTEFYEN